MNAYPFLIDIVAESREQAIQVLIERLGPDEDYGFEYQINYVIDDERIPAGADAE